MEGDAVARNAELNQKMKDERRDKILKGALKLFAKKGLAATRINDIAAEAGMSQGLIYHYYRSKEEIFTELVSTAFEKINEACRWLEAQNIPPEEKIALAVRELIKGIDENEDSGMFHLFVAQASASRAIPEDAGRIILEKNREPYEVLARIIRAGQDDGTLKGYNADELSLVFWSTIRGLAIFKALHGKRFKAPDPDIILNMFIKEKS
jgi:AcrR family transcriptional regulator